MLMLFVTIDELIHFKILANLLEKIDHHYQLEHVF